MTFNLSMEAATQYNLCRFVDKSSSERTSDKLRSNVLYIETDSARYEIARFTNELYDPVYRLAEVTDPLYKDDAFYAAQDEIPLAKCHLKEVLGEKLEWSDFLWGIDSLKVVKKVSEVELTKCTIGPIKNFMIRPTRSVAMAQ